MASDRAARREAKAAAYAPTQWDDSDPASASTRVCVACGQRFPNTAGYWPPLCMVPPWYSGDVPCNECFASEGK